MTKPDALIIISNQKKLFDEIKNLKKENTELKKRIEKFESDDSWRELIVYRKNGSRSPVELTWSDEELAETREYYRKNYTRNVIGLVKKLN